MGVERRKPPDLVDPAAFVLQHYCNRFANATPASRTEVPMPNKRLSASGRS